MQIILLSGGSGTRLWPLSNDARSKQFLRLLDSDTPDVTESMIQRVHRQIRNSGISADITIATSSSQTDSVLSQLGNGVDIVAEPSRRDTFPAIALACEYLARQKNCSPDETVIVMPCDSFTQDEYFKSLILMAEGVADRKAELIVMGIRPTYPSAKYGYIIPAKAQNQAPVIAVENFTEKPSVEKAAEMIEAGAFWNGGVFAFRLGLITDIARRYNDGESFNEIRDNYERYPKISFDYEVAEKSSDIGAVVYDGEWKDLGTWNTLTDELRQHAHGNVIMDGTAVGTHVINELNIPVLCLGTSNLVIASSPDGILVSEKSKCENIKKFADRLKKRPMYEERRWGTYTVIDDVRFPDDSCALTKRLTLNPGKSISYQRHNCRSEVWTFIDGEGEIVLDGKKSPVKRGDTITIPAGTMHTLRATTLLTFIEVQQGSKVEESDIERFDYNWD